MPVSTLVFNSQKFIFNGESLQRIKFEGDKKQKRRVVIPHKERPMLLAMFKDETLGDCERWKLVAEKWNNSIVGIFEPFVEKR